MSDFFQNGVIATLHRLGRQNPDALEERLIAHSRVMPTARPVRLKVRPTRLGDAGRAARRMVLARSR